MKNIVVNAVGEACPMPVVKAIKALGEIREPSVVEVYVDNETAVGNLTRLANEKKLKSESEELEENRFVVRMTVENGLSMDISGEDAPAYRCDTAGDTVVVISSDQMGTGSGELGATLMKGFIYALSQLDKLPRTMLFYNGGAKLTVEGSAAVEDLRNMERRGVEILTCGTCLNYFGLTEKLAVGSATNMYSIVEKMSGAGHIVRP